MTTGVARRFAAKPALSLPELVPPAGVRRRLSSSPGSSSLRRPAVHRRGVAQRRSAADSGFLTGVGLGVSVARPHGADALGRRVAAYPPRRDRSAADWSAFLYILDEPSIGLHPRDNDRLLETLRDGSATWATPSSSSSTTKTRCGSADHLIDFGPGPGVRGGRRRRTKAAPPTVAKSAEESDRCVLEQGSGAIEVPKERRHHRTNQGGRGKGWGRRLKLSPTPPVTNPTLRFNPLRLPPSPAGEGDTRASLKRRWRSPQQSQAPSTSRSR